MTHAQKKLLWGTFQVVLVLVLIACNRWLSSPAMVSPAVEQNFQDQPYPTPVILPSPTFTVPPNSQPTQALAIQLEDPPPSIRPTSTQAGSPVLFDLEDPSIRSEPAGCLSAEGQSTLNSVDQMLAYANSFLGDAFSLSALKKDLAWNGYTQTFYSGESGEVVLDIAGIKNLYRVQHILNALQVAGFVTWLRDGKDGKGLEVLAIPLQGSLDPGWAPYVLSYWQSRDSLPEGDSLVRMALKLPPCHWMVAAGFAPQIGAEWWPAERIQAPDYADAAETYQAANVLEAEQIARRINWLGPEGLEGVNTMCGPLSWSILQDARAFPPGFGGWSVGPKQFWLADPVHNGRPWSLFPSDSYRLTHFSEAFGTFDFQQWSLYPGDFVYTYSQKDGFDHMLVVTEVDAEGNVFTVTNLLKVYPAKKTTIERAILYNLYDPTIGLARNDWLREGENGRTGQDGFDVFRWAWMDKNIRQSPMLDTVRPGDSFRLMAERWRTPAEEIARYNQRLVEDTLVVGELLIIPPVPVP